MDARLLYNTLLDEIAKDERELMKKRAFADALRDRLVMVDGDNPSGNLFVAAASQWAWHSSTGEPPRPSTRYLIEKIVADLKGAEFSGPELIEEFKRRGYRLPSAAKTKIAGLLSDMVARAQLVKTHTGIGSLPNRYRAAGFESTAPEEPALHDVEDSGKD